MFRHFSKNLLQFPIHLFYPSQDSYQIFSKCLNPLCAPSRRYRFLVDDFRRYRFLVHGKIINDLQSSYLLIAAYQPVSSAASHPFSPLTAIISDCSWISASSIAFSIKGLTMASMAVLAPSTASFFPTILHTLDAF